MKNVPPRGFPRKRKLHLTPELAQCIAERFVASHDLKGWRYVCYGVKVDPMEIKRWIVLFETYSPQGSLVDGGPLVAVDDETRDAQWS